MIGVCLPAEDFYGFPLNDNTDPVWPRGLLFKNTITHVQIFNNVHANSNLKLGLTKNHLRPNTVDLPTRAHLSISGYEVRTSEGFLAPDEKVLL